MSNTDPAPGAAALHKQLESDAGPHATPDQERAAEKRRAALQVAEGRNSKPVERRSPDSETTESTPKRGKK